MNFCFSSTFFQHMFVYMFRITLITWSFFCFFFYFVFIFFSQPINLVLFGGINLVCKRFSMWLVKRMVAILDLLNRGASGEAGCEGSLDK